jgi:hypothetical protein
MPVLSAQHRRCVDHLQPIKMTVGWRSSGRASAKAQRKRREQGQQGQQEQGTRPQNDSAHSKSSSSSGSGSGYLILLAHPHLHTTATAASLLPLLIPLAVRSLSSSPPLHLFILTSSFTLLGLQSRPLHQFLFCSIPGLRHYHAKQPALPISPNTYDAKAFNEVKLAFLFDS